MHIVYTSVPASYLATQKMWRKLERNRFILGDCPILDFTSSLEPMGHASVPKLYSIGKIIEFRRMCHAIVSACGTY
jgi:hypothetical protein